jgi:predicted RNase H-like HicB family nuclease
MSRPMVDRSQFTGAGAAAAGERHEEGARKYFAVIVQEHDMAFHATFPDLPGCVAMAPTFDAARGAAGRALACRLANMERAGDAVPEPSTLAAIVSGEDEHCGAAILVREDDGHSSPDG